MGEKLQSLKIIYQEFKDKSHLQTYSKPNQEIQDEIKLPKAKGISP